MDHFIVNDTHTLKKYIRYCEDINAYDKIKTKFRQNNIIDDDDFLTVGVGTFNVFASIVTGNTQNNVDQSLLGKHADKFVLCHNRPINDEKWDDPEFYGASMAGPDENGPGHVFITTKNLHFDTFNILPIVLKKNTQFIQDLLLAALEYTGNRGWKNPGFYFHCYPNNSVQSLHIHVVNKDKPGPTFHTQCKKNLCIYDVLNVLNKEKS